MCPSLDFQTADQFCLDGPWRRGDANGRARGREGPRMAHAKYKWCAMGMMSWEPNVKSLDGLFYDHQDSNWEEETATLPGQESKC